MKIKFYEFFSKKLLLQFDVVFDSGKKIVTSAVYRQLGDSNSQWHKKNLQKMPVGGSPSWGTNIYILYTISSELKLYVSKRGLKNFQRLKMLSCKFLIANNKFLKIYEAKAVSEK